MGSSIITVQCKKNGRGAECLRIGNLALTLRLADCWIYSLSMIESEDGSAHKGGKEDPYRSSQMVNIPASVTRLRKSAR
jgi:hypothetical protein